MLVVYKCLSIPIEHASHDKTLGIYLSCVYIQVLSNTMNEEQ